MNRYAVFSLLALALVATIGALGNAAFHEVKQAGINECTAQQAALNTEATGKAAAELSTELTATLDQVNQESEQASQTAAKLAQVSENTKVNHADFKTVQTASAGYRLGPDFVRVFNKLVSTPPGSGPAGSS